MKRILFVGLLLTAMSAWGQKNWEDRGPYRASTNPMPHWVVNKIKSYDYNKRKETSGCYLVKVTNEIPLFVRDALTKEVAEMLDKYPDDVIWVYSKAKVIVFIFLYSEDEVWVWVVFRYI